MRVAKISMVILWRRAAEGGKVIVREKKEDDFH